MYKREMDIVKDPSVIDASPAKKILIDPEFGIGGKKSSVSFIQTAKVEILLRTVVNHCSPENLTEG